jgi:hypothetical protein
MKCFQLVNTSRIVISNGQRPQGSASLYSAPAAFWNPSTGPVSNALDSDRGAGPWSCRNTADSENALSARALTE